MEDFQVPALGSPGLDAYTVCSCSALIGVQGRAPTGRVLPPVHRQLTVAENRPSGAIDPWFSGCRGLQGLSSLGP